MKISDVPTRAEDLFCYGLYTTSHAVNRAYAPHLRALGLTYPQYITLTLLWAQDGQKVNALARKLGMETSTLTPLVKRLEVLGHVVRCKSPEDGRAVEVHLTEAGRGLAAKAPAITACMIGQSGLDPKELEVLQDLLARLRSGLQVK
jgi:DNA-binding MarR family transcriptional regulator